MFRIVDKITNAVAWIISPFVSKHFLETWKPIHLCWWFEKHNKPIPKYFIGIAGGWQNPTVTTDTATAISIDTIYVEGTNTDPHSDDGRPVTARGFVWIEGAGTPTVNDNVITVGTVGAGSFSANIEGLNFNTLYSIRAYATNQGGTGYGDTLTATTEAGQDYTQQLSDIISFSDEITKSREIEKSFSDTITLSDDFSRIAEYERNENDIITLSDDFNRIAEYERTKSDETTLSENLSPSVDYERSESDEISFFDGYNGGKRRTFSIKILENDLQPKKVDSDLNIQILQVFIKKQIKEADIIKQKKESNIADEEKNAKILTRNVVINKEAFGTSKIKTDSSIKNIEIQLLV